MKKAIRVVAMALGGIFVLITSWCVTVQGVFETAQLDPESTHFLAGAGGLTLLIRGCLAVLSTVALLISSVLAPAERSRLPSVAAALVMIPLFLFSCLGLERWAPGYSERAFRDLLDRRYRGESFGKPEVVAALGPPLVTAVGPEGGEVWCYSYMPSCGFGWDKRVIWFHGRSVTRVYAMDEP